MHLDIPVIGILRGVESSFFSDIMKTAFAEGLQAVEVTMNTEDAERIVSTNRSYVPPGKFLGMGTIRNLDEAKRATGAGAMFLVSPNVDHQVIEYGRSENIPVIAGALSPTEVYAAWSAGAEMVKVFPCRSMGGAAYIRDLLGPFDQIPLVAVGGVTLDNLSTYFEAGAAAVGVSTSLFGKDFLEKKDIKALARNVRSFISNAQISIKSKG